MSSDSQPCEQKPLRLNGTERSMILVLSILWDASLGQPQRPASEFFLKPSLPIRYVYMTRILVNLLWFSRNYFNWTLLISIVLIFFIPHSALILIMSVSMHLIKRRSLSRNVKSNTDKNTRVSKGNELSITIILLMILQLSACVVVCYMCGIFPLIGYIIIVVVPVILHALFTPYTDDAFELYRTVLRDRDVHVPMPRSPTRHFDVVDPTFEALVKGDTSTLTPKVRGYSGESEYTLASQRSFPAPRQSVKEDAVSVVRRMRKGGAFKENSRFPDMTGKYLKRTGLKSPGKTQQKNEPDSYECIASLPSITPANNGLNSTTLQVREPFRHLRLQMNEEDVTLLPIASPHGLCSVLSPSINDFHGEGKKIDEANLKGNTDHLVKSMESSQSQEISPIAVGENAQE
ncbi:Prenylated rab acceptor PRA1 [Trypanosoma melophagium]|uniref:Prenylated rab acceptor PRA1 n=1 Tax=Trypanosoma melophagium TaxID=715481 RepID=UPI00351A91D2|nr:Prenylated rab acceptor PRA1 [Trypanosoma melophagium]